MLKKLSVSSLKPIPSLIENLGLRLAKPFNPRYAGLRSNLVHVSSSRFLR